jgi:mRNA interferase RelE/StbE
MAYLVVITKTASKDLRALPPTISQRILKKIYFYAATEYPLLFAHPLKHSTIGQYRFRVGDYRVLVDVNDTTLILLRVGHSRDIYHI